MAQYLVRRRLLESFISHGTAFLSVIFGYPILQEGGWLWSFFRLRAAALDDDDLSHDM